jgi:N-methylhydantoinase A
MESVVIPTTPGVLSALGGLIADIKNDFIATVFVDLGAEALPTIRGGFETLEKAALHWLRKEQAYDGPHRFAYSADMRYHGQSHEIETMLDATQLKRGDIAALAEAFHRRHEEVYDHADREAPVQIINLRLVIAGESPKPRFTRAAEVASAATPSGHARVFLEGAGRDIPVFTRASLSPGQIFDGPAVVTQSDCTSCIPGGYHARVDAYRNLILTRAGAGN